MKLRVFLGVLVFTGATIAITSNVASQDEKTKAEDPMMQACMKYADPGEFHAHLQPLVGKWKQSVKWWMAANAEPEISTGTSEYKWIMGKRFVLQEVKGTMEDTPFEGMGMIGYDNFKKKYTSMWVDSMTTSIMTSMGKCDDSGKVFTMVGHHDDVFTGKENQEFRTIVRIINNDMHVDEMFMTGLDGKEFKMLEITYTRM